MAPLANFPPASSEAVPATVAMATVLAITLSPIAFDTPGVATFANAELMKPEENLPPDSSEETPPMTPCATTRPAADSPAPPAQPKPPPVTPPMNAALKSPPLAISPAPNPPHVPGGSGNLRRIDAVFVGLHDPRIAVGALFYGIRQAVEQFFGHKLVLVPAGNGEFAILPL